MASNQRLHVRPPSEPDRSDASRRTALSTESPTIFALSSDVTVATFANLILCDFRRETPASCVEPLRRAVRSLEDEHVIFFSVIQLESVPPGDEARRALTSFFEEHARRLSCATVTYYGEGFRGAMIRAIASGVLSLSPRLRGFPKHIVSSLPEAARLAGPYAPAVGQSEIVRAFETVASMPAPPPR